MATRPKSVAHGKGVRTRKRKSDTELPESCVAVLTSNTEGKSQLLERALSKSRFWLLLERNCYRLDSTPAEYSIAIKIDNLAFDVGPSCGTDPELVEHLIELLYERGFANVRVVASTDSSSFWLENRDPISIADICGYRFRTTAGDDYDIIDSSDDLLEGPFPAGCVLHGTSLSRTWLEAQFRISFAKNRTDESHGYSLALENVLGVLPLRDKRYHYYHRMQSSDVCTELIRHVPVHFSLIDAYVSNHGSEGVQRVSPIETHTLIAGDDILLVDWLGAAKMGVDPYVSPINTAALQEFGLSKSHSIEGEVSPYANFINVQPLRIASAKRRNQWNEVSRLLEPLSQQVNREYFPFKDPVLDRLNGFVTRLLSSNQYASIHSRIVVAINFLIGSAYQLFHTRNILLCKDRLRQLNAPINVDAADYVAKDYAKIVDELRPLEDLLRATEENEAGFKWRYLEKSVLFSCSKTLPIPYAQFVGSVDIAKAISMLNDYIGGESLPTAFDRQGRTISQIERNIYLPQPNYFVLYQGDVIDVTKIEIIRYGKRSRQIYWKTVQSENHSAVFDDGTVRFEETAEGFVQVQIMGRQEFVIPPILQLLKLDQIRPLRDFLVKYAYSLFFQRTIANFEALVEGRSIRIGQPWSEQDTDPFQSFFKEGLDKSSQFLSDLTEPIQELLRLQIGKVTGPKGVVDENGFTHFSSYARGDAIHELQSEFQLPGMIAGLIKEFLNIVKDLFGAAVEDLQWEDIISRCFASVMTTQDEQHR